MSAVQAPLMVQSSRRSTFRHWIARHPVAAYFVMAYFLTWILELPMVMGQDGLGIFPFHVPMPIYVILFLASSYTGPTGAALYITSVIEGREGVRLFFKRYTQWRVGFQWYLFAFLALPLIYLISASFFPGMGPFSALAKHWSLFFTLYLPALLIFPAFITWGEEPGWRGFALTHLQEKYHPLVSSLVVGLLHGLWHLPIFLLVYGPPAQGPFSLSRFLINTLGIMLLTVLWTWVFNNAKQSILIAVLLHASSNANGAFIHALLPDLPKQTGQVAMIVYFLLAVILVIVTRGRLSYRASRMGDQ